MTGSFMSRALIVDLDLELSFEMCAQVQLVESLCELELELVENAVRPVPGTRQAWLN